MDQDSLRSRRDSRQPLHALTNRRGANAPRLRAGLAAAWAGCDPRPLDHSFARSPMFGGSVRASNPNEQDTMKYFSLERALYEQKCADQIRLKLEAIEHFKMLRRLYGARLVAPTA